MSAEQFGGVLRAILAFAGGYVVSKGLVDEATMTVVVGGLVTIGVAFWSWYIKKPA